MLGRDDTKRWRDHLLTATCATRRALRDIAKERKRQDALKESGKFKHTCEDIGLTRPESAYVILGEEYGEVGRAIQELWIAGKFNSPFQGESARAKRIAHLREELVQVAAVATAWVEAIDKGEDT